MIAANATGPVVFREMPTASNYEIRPYEGRKLAPRRCRTPYGRLSTRLSQARDAENRAWLGPDGRDRRATGEAAKAQMLAKESDAFAFIRRISTEAIRAAFERARDRASGVTRHHLGQGQGPPALHRKVLGNG